MTAASLYFGRTVCSRRLAAPFCRTAGSGAGRFPERIAGPCCPGEPFLRKMRDAGCFGMNKMVRRRAFIPVFLLFLYLAKRRFGESHAFPAGSIPLGMRADCGFKRFRTMAENGIQPGAPAPEKHSGGDRPLGEQEGIPAVLRESFTERMRPWWARFTAWVKRIWAPVWKRLRKFISVPFLVMLLLSFTLWYAIKLGYTYQAEIPVLVNVDGHVFEVNCMVEGQGTRLFTKRHSKGKPLELSWSHLDVSPSAINPGWVVISPYSLQNAISARNTDIKFLSVGPIPEIEL